MKILELAALDITLHRFVLPLMKKLKEEGWEVGFACRPGEKARQIEELGFKFFPIRATRRLHPVEIFLEFQDIRRVLRLWRPQVLHVHTPLAAFLGRMAGRLERVPLIVYTAHGFYHHEGMPFLKRAAFESLERLALRRWTDLLFLVSREDWTWIIKENLLPPERAFWIGNGVDTDYFSREAVDPDALRALRTQLGEGRVVLTAGRVVREKGFFELAAASKIIVRKIPDALFVLAGDGPDMGSLKNLIRKLGVEGHWRLLGWREDVRELMALAEVFVLPSWREGLPRSILEAMAMGLPVVATDIRGCREEVVNGETGLLVPPKDPTALAKAILKLLNMKDWAKRMGAAGRKRVEEIFDEQKVIEEQMKILEAFASKIA